MLKLFPSFRSWIQAFRLAIPTFLGTIVFSVYFWAFLIGPLVLTVVSLEPEGLVISLLSLVSLAIGFLWYLAIKILYFFLLRLLWSSPPKWLRPKLNWKHSLKNFCISVLATIPIAIQFLIPLLVKAHLEVNYSLIFRLRFNIEEIILRNAWLWFICAALLLHLTDTGNRKKVSKP
ncbi:hypothetical protein [Leptolyngbya sp. 7M]|uniref:hypothetical protein n=1 Tax=Leptolyngbya sp. 7M TaxID=2812896 RepID=UPI001B8C65D5|nr:hypothetical protein [Leptolyngbya sp. 7M]QYO63338.1 hypothetical protein JVX88_25955 [Leptolyngbya sp. 7M]